jgi:hypothetical protein
MKKLEKTIEDLEQELDKLKKLNRASWDIYGSELCAGEMIAKEEALENRILKLKIKEDFEKNKFVEDPLQIIDN